MAECILAGECGCTVKGHEYAQKLAADDGLRKAALAVLDIARESRSIPTCLYQNLRAELNKDKSC